MLLQQDGDSLRQGTGFTLIASGNEPGSLVRSLIAKAIPLSPQIAIEAVWASSAWAPSGLTDRIVPLSRLNVGYVMISRMG